MSYKGTCRRFLLLFLGITSQTVFSFSNSIQADTLAKPDPLLRIARAIWGTPTSSRLVFMPFGYHIIQNPWGENNNQWLVDLTVKGIAAGTFVNSCKSRVYFGGVERDVFTYQQFSIRYLFAMMHGYRGQCGIAEALGPVLGHDPGPIIGLGASWAPTRHLSLDLVSYGVGILGGVSYIF